MNRMLMLLVILPVLPSLAVAQTNQDTAIIVKYQPNPTFEFRTRPQIPNDTIALLTDREFRTQNSIEKPTLLSLKNASEKILRGKYAKLELRNLAEDVTKQLSKEQVLALDCRVDISTLYHLGISRFCQVKGLDEHVVLKRLSDRKQIYLDQILDIERDSLSGIAKVLSEDANIELEDVLQLQKMGVVEQKLPIERTVASKEVSTAQEDSAHGQSSR